MDAHSPTAGEVEALIRQAFDAVGEQSPLQLAESPSSYDAVPDTTPIAELTLEQLRELIARVVREELTSQAAFAEEPELELNPDFATELGERLASPGARLTASEVEAGSPQRP